MEGLLTNNIFFVYLLGILVILNYEAFEKHQKISIIYVCSYGLMFKEDLRCYLIIFLLLIILFLYEEYLNKDLVKIQYITSFGFKVLDFAYMYIFQYKIIYILGAIILKSRFLNVFLAEVILKDGSLTILLGNLLGVISILLLITGIHKIFNNTVELKSFTQINQKFSEYPYYLLPLNKDSDRDILFNKLELVAEIEDYTFFERKNSYSFFSIEFIKEVIKKKKTFKENSNINNQIDITYFLRKLKLFISFHNLKYFLKYRNKIRIIKYLIKKIFFFVVSFSRIRYERGKIRLKRVLRGYSTIEMQLIRILAYKKGLKVGKPKSIKDLDLILTRKIFEVIYATIFFSGHKKYLNIKKEKDYYRYYLVYIYLHTVQTSLNGRTYAPLDRIFGKVDVIEWPKEALFIIILGLNSMRITKKRVEIYLPIIHKYDMDIDLIYQLVDCL